MAQRRSLLLPALFLAAVFGSDARGDAQVPEPDRIALPDGGRDPVDLQADTVVTWIEGDTRIVGLSGNALIRQGTTQVKARKAFIWEKLNQPRNSAHSLTVYAYEAVRVEVLEKTSEHRALVAQWKTQGKTAFLKNQLDDASVAGSPLYRQALAAREGRSLAPESLTIAFPRESPATASSGIQPVQFVQPPAVQLDPTPGALPNPQPIDPKQGPRGPTNAEPPVFQAPPIKLPAVDTRTIKIGSRTNAPYNGKVLNLPGGEQVLLVTGGIKILATFPQRNELTLDIEADQVVVWQTGGGSENLMDSMSSREGMTVKNDKHIEVYLSGNVVLRYGSKSDIKGPDGTPVDTKIMRAEQLYYDVTKNTALGLKADLEITKASMNSGVPISSIDPTHLTAAEIMQLSPQEWQTTKSVLSASKLPADPALKMTLAETTLFEQKAQPRNTIFGLPTYDRITGLPISETARTYEVTSSVVRIADVPVMYFPYLKGDANDPAGPLSAFSFRQDTIFGYQFYTTWDVLEMIGVTRLPGEHWGLMLDYLTNRGPGFGTNYSRTGQTMFGEEAPYNILFKAYGIYDHGSDTLAGTRQYEFQPTAMRDRILFQYQQQYQNWYVQSQFSYLSDHNFLETYYNYEFNQGPNQETFLHLKYQEGIGAATVLAEPNVDRPWVTETQWLPKLDGYWLGQSLLWDHVTWNTWGSAAYANLRTYNLPADQLPVGTDPNSLITENPISTARLDWYQQFRAPLSLGFLKVVPYANTDLAYYSQDVNGDSRGRVYGGLGSYVTASLTRLYDEVENEFLNLKGLNHKIAFTANYYNAWTDTPASLLPQLDRLNDDATQQSIRDILPWYQTYLPGPNGNALATLPLYDPRQYAIRRLVDTRVDTLDNIQVLQLDLRQRLQTQRGFDGQEHTLDWMVFDLSASIFPEKNRDNFGHPVGFVEYNGSWAIGDRNGVTSAGWFDPFAFGTHYWNISPYYNRPDGTSFNLSYRQLDPVGSKIVTGSVAYSFSPKYRVTYTAAFDFGAGTGLTHNFNLTRTGTDLTASIGFSYNALINNVGFTMILVPNFLAARGLANSPIALNGANSSAMGR